MAEDKVVLSFLKISNPETLVGNDVTASGYILNISTTIGLQLQIHRVLARTLARSSRNLLQF